MKRKVVTAFLMAALGSSLVFSQAAMAAGTADKTENTAEAGTEEETESFYLLFSFLISIYNFVIFQAYLQLLFVSFLFH